jgi:catechol 2,3-dioxygenase-like lactoylglutathione lyase family enzyme
MIDHIYVPVRDVTRSTEFYARALESLGWRAIGAYDASAAPERVPDAFGFGDQSGASIWLQELETEGYKLYIGIAAPDRAAVDAVYAAALGAGAINNDGPGIRRYFGDGYYAANVFDPDGHSLEFVHKSYTPSWA